MKPTVIIVDDCQNARERVHLALQAEFEVVEEAENGLKAVEACLRHKPQLVVMDIVMPIFSGIEAIAMIHEKVSPTPKILMVSGYKEERIILEALQKGASDFLFKPFNEAMLLEAALALVSPAESDATV